jgi:hypothetical protein
MLKRLAMGCFISILFCYSSHSQVYPQLEGVVIDSKGEYVSVLIKEGIKSCLESCLGLRTFRIDSKILKSLKVKNLIRKKITFIINSPLCMDNTKIINIMTIQEPKKEFLNPIRRVK